MVIVVVATGSEHNYHVAVSGPLGSSHQDAPANPTQLVGFLSASVVLTSSSVNSTVYSPVAAFEASAAGFILLTMVSVGWPCSSIL